MSGNTFGQIFRLTTFGESHGAALGGIIDGCPAGIMISENFIQKRLDRRRPGNSDKNNASTSRKEPDKIQILSGIFEGKSTGTPIAFIVYNENAKSGDYSHLANVFRPGHADITYNAKYGIRDYRGGGRASGRETLARVAGGAIAEAMLAAEGIFINAATIELGGIIVDPLLIDMENAHTEPYFAAHTTVVPAWEKRIKECKEEGDTLGGIVQIVAQGVPAGLGEPVFNKLDAVLAAAIMSVGAVKGVEIGSGFAAARMTGSHNNDPIFKDGFSSNNAGGILGGISSGQDIILRAAVKPIPSIAMEQISIDTDDNPVCLKVGGRHDICAIPRIVPVLSAMTALSLADALLLQKRMLLD